MHSSLLCSTVETNHSDQQSQKNLMNLSFCQSFATGGAHVLGIDSLLDACTAEYMAASCRVQLSVTANLKVTTKYYHHETKTKTNMQGLTWYSQIIACTLTKEQCCIFFEQVIGQNVLETKISWHTVFWWCKHNRTLDLQNTESMEKKERKKWNFEAHITDNQSRNSYCRVVSDHKSTFGSAIKPTKHNALWPCTLCGRLLHQNMVPMWSECTCQHLCLLHGPEAWIWWENNSKPVRGIIKSMRHETTRTVISIRRRLTEMCMTAKDFTKFIVYDKILMLKFVPHTDTQSAG